MNTIYISIKNKSDAPEIIKKVYKCGDIDYNIYNYNPDVKSRDFSAIGYPEQASQFDEQLTKQLDEDDDFREWSNIGAIGGKVCRTDETFTIQPPSIIHRDTCEPSFCKISKACKDNNISFEELLDIYKKDENYHRYGNFRSVVTCNDHIVTIAPIKSSSFETFKSINQYSSLDFTKQLCANEVIEGTMINLFYNNFNSAWEIATKSAIGGNYWFYRTQYNGSTEFDKQMTFRQMFMEALGEDFNSELGDSTVVKQLNTDFTYSFVMQHPANHIVLNIAKPTIYLVAGFRIEGDDKITQYSPFDMSQSAFNGSINNLPILLPRTVDIDDKNIEDISRIAECYDAGIMLHSKINGKRIKIKNDTYERLKDIRGNNPNIHYHYLSLFASGNVNEFLSQFPIYKKLFNQFYNQSYNFIKEVHDAYVSYYVNKNGKSVRVNKSIFTHIYTLHSKYYIPAIDSEFPIIVTRDVVAKYYNAMTPKEKLYHVNYKTREFTNKQDDGVKNNLITASY
jgi:hypothetical protein